MVLNLDLETLENRIYNQHIGLMFMLLGHEDNKLFTRADRSGAVCTRQKESWDKALITIFARKDQERYS